MVIIFANIIVRRRPAVSNITPHIILPSPLQMDNMPTRDVAKLSAAPINIARSLAKLITVLPTAASEIVYRKNFQKVNMPSICKVV